MGRGIGPRHGLFDDGDPAKPPKTDYNLALIDLQEGPRLMSRVQSVPPVDVETACAYMRMIVREEDHALVVFEPAS